MTKDYALKLLGGNARNAAKLLGRTDAAVSQWRKPLTRAIEGQVMLAFHKLPKSQQIKNRAIADNALIAEAGK